MSAADWLTSDAVTEALAKIKAENEREEVRCAECGTSRRDYLRELANRRVPDAVPCCEDPALPYWHADQWRVAPDDQDTLCRAAWASG